MSRESNIAKKECLFEEARSTCKQTSKRIIESTYISKACTVFNRLKTVIDPSSHRRSITNLTNFHIVRICGGDVTCKCGFVWPDSSALVGYTNWQGLHPRYSPSCVRINDLGEWGVATCTDQFAIVCEGKTAGFMSHSSFVQVYDKSCVS